VGGALELAFPESQRQQERIDGISRKALVGKTGKREDALGKAWR